MLKIKKLSALILIAILSLTLAVLGVICVTAQAAEVSALPNEYIEYSEDGTQLIGLRLPEDFEDDFKVVVPDTVTSIGANAFNGVKQLVEVTLSKNLTSIGNSAFAGTSISSVSIPSGVTSIDAHAFNECSLLTSVTFEKQRTAALNIGIMAFVRCSALSTVSLPDKTTVSQFAFDGCASLSWVYVGEDCQFVNAAQGGIPNATFFPTSNKELLIIFPNLDEYNQTMSQSDETFKNSNGRFATYVVKINCYVGADSQPKVYERLHGRNFNYVKDGDAVRWNVDTAFSDLPAQDASYASTTWYSEASLTNAVTYDKVNELLNGNVSEIKLYCHETVLAPEFPAEPVSWVYSDDVSYDITDKAQVLQALGCKQSFTEAQLAAMDINVMFANEKGESVETPDAIKANGVYSVTVKLNSAYGLWSQTVNPSVTVNVDTSAFNIVLIVFLILGTIGLIATVSTAIIRKKIQDRHKRKQITQKEVLEKYKAIGGETKLIK